MNKITVGEVRRAVAYNKLPLISNMFVNYEFCVNIHNSKLCGACAISQLYIKNNIVRQSDPEYDIEVWAYKKYGKNFTIGFIQGFDDEPSEKDDFIHIHFAKHYHQGYIEGQKIRKYLKPLSL